MEMTFLPPFFLSFLFSSTVFCCSFSILPSCCQLIALGCVTSDSRLSLSSFLSPMGPSVQQWCVCIVCAVGVRKGSTGLPLFTAWQRGVPLSAFVCPSSASLRPHTAPPLASPGKDRPKYSSRTEERGVSPPLQHLQLRVIDKHCTGLSISLQHQGIEWLRKTVI